MNEKKKAIQNLLPEIGGLIEKFQLETGATFKSLRAETGLHHNTYKRSIEGHPNQLAINLLLLIAELMQRDRSDSLATDRFFESLRKLLDDAFDES